MLLHLAWLPITKEFRCGLWTRGEKHGVLLLYDYIFLQWLFVVDSCKAANNCPSLILQTPLLDQIILAESLQFSLSINWLISSKGILLFPQFHSIFLCIFWSKKKSILWTSCFFQELFPCLSGLQCIKNWAGCRYVNNISNHIPWVVLYIS